MVSRKSGIKVKRKGAFTAYMKKRFGSKAFNSNGKLKRSLVEKVKWQASEKAERARSPAARERWTRLARQANFALVARKWKHE